MSQRLKVEVWSDIACPWCFIGKRRLETALREFPNADEVEVEWRSFELDPRAPRVRDKSLTHNERLAKKYGMSVERAQAVNARLTGIASEEGLSFDFERIQSGNTFDAHRLLHLAKERGLQDALKERLMHAYLCEGEAIGEPETLQRLATDAGLDADQVQAVLATDQYASEVRADQAAAQKLGVDGVPFFKIAHYGASGAQPAELLLKILDKAWSELPAPLEKISADGGQCIGETCAVSPPAGQSPSGPTPSRGRSAPTT